MELWENPMQTDGFEFVFTKTVIGPGSSSAKEKGWGEGNFKALFESIEEDQIRHRVLKAAA